MAIGTPHFFDSARLLSSIGSPDGATVHFYYTGTTNPAPIYTDRALTTLSPNPLIIAVGQILPRVYLDPSITYRRRLIHALDGSIFDSDPLAGDLPELGGATGSTIVGHKQTDALGATRTVASKLNDFVNVLDFVQPSDPDLTNALERVCYTAFPGVDALTVYIPRGVYTITRQIIPARQINFRGDGFFATILDFKNVASLNTLMKGAINFGLLTTLTAAGATAGKIVASGANLTNGSDYSTVSDIQIKISGTRPANFHYGIWNAARLFCQNVFLHTCGKVDIAGNLILGTGVVAGNANLSGWINCHSYYATEHGFLCDGDDSNAIKHYGCNGFQSVGQNFYDASFLGNSYTDCHSDGSTNGYKSISGGGTNASAFIACYQEGNTTSTAWSIASPGIIIQPKGANPANPTTSLNITVRGANLGGVVLPSALNFNATYDGNSLGSAGTPATRIQPEGLIVRGTDSDAYQLVRQGGSFLGGGGPGISMMRFNDPAGTQTEIVNYGRADGALECPQGVAVAGNKVLGARGAALPADATDLASAIALVNAMKARLVAHGLVA